MYYLNHQSFHDPFCYDNEHCAAMCFGNIAKIMIDDIIRSYELYVTKVFEYDPYKLAQLYYIAKTCLYVSSNPVVIENRFGDYNKPNDMVLAFEDEVNQILNKNFTHLHNRYDTEWNVRINQLKVIAAQTMARLI